MKTQKLKQIIANIKHFLTHSPWNELYLTTIENMEEKIDYPCELAITGRVKAGKSSFINALLGDDYAMVGITETTATINYFKYGYPNDPNKPIKVIFDNGTIEYHSRVFLDSLQGNDNDTIKRANGIDHIEYILPLDILKSITLIDTPGTDALVSAHNERTSNYFNSQLRDKHTRQSTILAEKADAIIQITERVPTATTKDSLLKYFDTENSNISAFNAIGIMTKIDMESNVDLKDWQRRCNEFSNLMRHKLNIILPVSAGVYRAVTTMKKSGELALLQSQLKKIPSENGIFEDIVGNSLNFLDKDGGYNEYLSQIGLSYNSRLEMCDGLDYDVFYIIAKELYNYPIEEAYIRLTKYSGMNEVMNILDKHFFKRSKEIRCARILKEIHFILEEIKMKQLYNLRLEVENRETFIKLLNSEQFDSKNATTINALKQFILSHICTQSKYDYYESKLKELVDDVESLQQSFQHTDANTKALLLLQQHQNFFNESEIFELEILFGKYADKRIETNRKYLGTRQSYWRGKRHQVIGKPGLLGIIDAALHTYETL